MTNTNSVKLTLIAGLFFLSLGGWLLHLRVHPPAEELSNLVPFITGIISVFILPLMFAAKTTLPYAYVINGMLVIIGTITMAHVSIMHLKELSFTNVVLKTMFPNIVMLWARFSLGKALFDLEFFSPEAVRAGRFLRYPNTGWWLAHLIAMSAVYAAGAIFW